MSDQEKSDIFILISEIPENENGEINIEDIVCLIIQNIEVYPR